MSAEQIPTDVGILWYKSGDEGVTTIVQGTGTWEPHTGKAIRSVLQEGDFFVDVGAHVGYFSVMAAQIVGETGSVMAFEPHPENVQLLSKNLAPYANSVICPLALAETRGAVALYPSAVNSGDNRLSPHARSAGAITVQTLPLDGFGIKRLDFLKIDTQASDHKVMEGARETIERCRPFITTEYWPEGLLEAGVDPQSVLKFYKDLGYDYFVLGGGPLPVEQGYCELWLEPR